MKITYPSSQPLRPPIGFSAMPIIPTPSLKAVNTEEKPYKYHTMKTFAAVSGVFLLLVSGAYFFSSKSSVKLEKFNTARTKNMSSSYIDTFSKKEIAPSSEKILEAFTTFKNNLYEYIKKLEERIKIYTNVNLKKQIIV